MRPREREVDMGDVTMIDTSVFGALNRAIT
jgi:hypothetical protein